MKNDNSPAAVYERFKLEWMLAHGYTLQHLVAELEKLREGVGRHVSARHLCRLGVWLWVRLRDLALL